MQAKHHIILYTFLSLALVIAVFLALTYGVQARRTAQALEDTYAQRVLETQEHLQAVQLKLSKTPVAADTRTQVELLTGVSRQAEGVVSGLAALPLSHAAMSDTVKFCNQLSDYALQLALRVASGSPVSETDAQRLNDLASQCSLLLGQFATARDAMVRDSLSLTAQSSVFYSEMQHAQRPLEQVGDKDNGMDYPSMIYDGAFSDARHYGEPKALGRERVTQEQALELARAFVGADRVASAAPAPPTGGALPSYGVTLTLTDGAVLNADVTQQGGKMLWLMPEHAQFAPTLTLEECAEAARSVLAQKGYGELHPDHYQVYDGLAVINLVPVQGGVLLYPDLVKAQMRMDTGELVGLEANNYLMNHTERDAAALTPMLTEQEALTQVSPTLGATSARLCMIPYRDAERLCYEAVGVYRDHEYRVYIDANTGDELEVLMIVDSPSGELAA